MASSRWVRRAASGEVEVTCCDGRLQLDWLYNSMVWVNLGYWVGFCYRVQDFLFFALVELRNITFGNAPAPEDST